ncbi:type III polyketide synthase [Paenibacillus sp. VCA1]|uniref:type III polyketide synthase n=1 Tax=Paenibacillus sp. VCA1 TaxID=3039148 RepID=UPI0028714F06|nr:type III polyketide synthase [Paenibacillus sp. VCA1]MDR9855307.1 type III polyketide synthase [Paenibacillus sp. VCA1]
MKDPIFAGRTAITGIGTSIPPYKLEQDKVFQKIEDSCKYHSDLMRWARRIFRQNGVESRYTVEPDFLRPAGECRYLPDGPGVPVPTTAERMGSYERESVPLAVHAAREAMADARIHPENVTHLITVSCTGQFLPGLDSILLQELGLSMRVNRIPLQFQGCHAGLKAIQLARNIAESMEEHTVLVVCVELCTIHFQPPTSRDALFGASFFGDGASACVIQAASSRQENVFLLGQGHSVLVPDSREEMIWRVGDHGFDLYLSPAIPKLLKSFLREEIQFLLDDRELPFLWAVHPGGRGIVDAVQDIFALNDAQVSFSRNVLKHVGNLSSATILFVFKEMKNELVKQRKAQAEGISLAFGPGLTAELLAFTYAAKKESPEESRSESMYV